MDILKKGIIYCITNEINGRKYIGQTRRSLERRWKEHCWRDNCQVITQAINKHGKKNFKIEVLEKCDKDKLDEREKYWIEYHNTYKGDGYNTHKGGLTLGEGEDHPRTGQKTPEEVKEKMRQALKENGTLELRQGENHPFYGKKHTEEELEKMRSSFRENSPFDKKEAIKIIKKYYEENLIREDLAKKYNVSAGTIGRILNYNHWTMEDLDKPKENYYQESHQLALF